MPRRTIIIVIAILLVGGGLRLPVELGLAKEMRAQRLLQPPIDLSLREQLTQAGAFAVLGGFRSLLASIYDVKVFIAFEESPPDFDKIEAFYNVIHALQPYQERYWETAGWYMAHNASAFYEHRSDLREAIRIQRRADYIAKGVAILNKGLEILPNSERIHLELATIHSAQSRTARDPDPRKAAEHYTRAFEVSERPHYERLSAYEMVLLEDRESWEEAYQILRRHYLAGGRSRTPSVLRDIGILEARLDVPEIQRIGPEPGAIPGQ